MNHIHDLFIETIIENMPVGLMVINNEGGIVVSNQELVRILGLNREQIMGRGWGELFFEDDFNRDFNQVILDVIQLELVNLKRNVPYRRAADGQVLYLSMTSSFLKVQEGVIGVVLLMRDATEEHLMNEREKALLKETSRLEQERTVGLTKLSLSVAHQVRNPIMSIAGFANLMRRNKELPTVCCEHVGVILSETSKLEGVVKAVSRFASLPRARRQTISATAFMESVRQDFESRCATLPKKVVCENAFSLLDISVDPELLKRALDNIYQNAVDFCRGDKVFVSTTLETGKRGVVITIIDRGQGVAEEDMPFLFDPFFTTKSDGVGMGLCEAQRIVLEHQGELKIESSPGSWTRVTIDLPYTPAHASV